MSRKSNKGSFADKFILGIFIFSILFGLFFIIMLFDLKSILFYFFLSWTIIYSFLTYCWLDKEKWSTLERVAMPLIEDAGVLIWILIPVIGILFSLYNIISKVDVSNNVGVLIIMVIFMGMDIWLIKKDIFTLNSINYIRNRKR